MIQDSVYQILTSFISCCNVYKSSKWTGSGRHGIEVNITVWIDGRRRRRERVRELNGNSEVALAIKVVTSRQRRRQL